MVERGWGGVNGKPNTDNPSVFVMVDERGSEQ
jgi:hypothetical protein